MHHGMHAHISTHAMQEDWKEEGMYAFSKSMDVRALSQSSSSSGRSNYNRANHILRSLHLLTSRLALPQIGVHNLSQNACAIPSATDPH